MNTDQEQGAGMELDTKLDTIFQYDRVLIIRKISRLADKMNRLTLQDLTLSDFDISPAHGFLPPSDPLERASNFPSLQCLGTELPKLLAARELRRVITDCELAHLSELERCRDEEYRCLGRLLSFVGHGFVWEDPEHPADRLPANLAVPWHKVLQKLGRPPVLSYASYALDNWRRLDANKPVVLGNIVLIQNFLGGQDEEWFVLVHVEIEAKAGPALAGVVGAMNAVAEDNLDEVARNLWAVASAAEEMCKTLQRMSERCDPYIYYNRVRPYIHGWKDSPALPHGLLYEGVEQFLGRPQQFRGETGAQSSIIPSLDAALGVVHAEDPLTHYLVEMRQYMPPKHRAFIETLESIKDDQGRPLLYGYARDHRRRNEMLWKAFRTCVQLLARFREAHIEYAERYIHQQSERRKSNPTAVGTGGTPFMSYLNKHLEETKRFVQE